MERFMRTVADIADRRSFLRKLGKLGMGAAAAGAFLLPKKASACGLRSSNGAGSNSSNPRRNPCYGAVPGSSCLTGSGKDTSKHCIQDGDLYDPSACHCL